MFTIVIGDGLTNEFLSPEVQFQACPLTGTGCNTNYNSILDFVFLAGPA
jgi:hypothetical protein